MGEEVAANHDELQRMIERDELRDQIDAALSGKVSDTEQLKMTVIDYARARGITPQLVYYYIRNRKVATEKCICGRWVIDIADAEAFFTELAEKKSKR